MPLSVATWNINSVRLRLGLVRRFLAEYSPDVLCLQETKCPDGNFPLAAFREAGYGHIELHGQKGYHGVALISRLPLGSVDKRCFCGKEDARHIAATVEHNGRPITIHNLYIPAGGDTPDRTVNPKFGQKLDFIERMTRWSESLKEPTIIVGDFNVAPLECDVWSHKALLGVVSHTPIEVEALTRLQQAHSWTDIGRTFVPAPERCFTWWSYRSPDWTKNDRGRRLDHMWCSPELGGHVAAHEVLEPCRNWDRPSDHVPLICEIEV